MSEEGIDMPTIEELAAQVAALQQQVSAITTPPTEYYTSIYSGEEIDAAITNVRSGAVGVASFNGRMGAVMPQAGDYNATQIPVSGNEGSATVAEALNTKPNRSLLDNWYFAGGGTDGTLPVNQRRQMSYSNQGNIFDRWSVSKSSSAAYTAELLDDGVQISVTGEDPNSDYVLFHQRFPAEGIDLSRDVCLSFICNGELYQNHGTNGNVVATISGLNRAEISVSEDTIILRFVLMSGTSYKLKAVKVEYGSQQTLAHQDEDGNWVLNEIPDYGEELAKCQRYLIPMDANCCWGFASSETTAYLFFPLPVSMRTTPVVQGNPPTSLFPVDGNSVTALSVFSPSAIKNMIALQVNGSGFTANKPYSLNQTIGFLSAEL